MAMGDNGDRQARNIAADPAFDRPHLVRYTLDDPDLEKEIIGLFLQQLPSMVAMLEQAEGFSAWKMATHTLKGSAATVGASAIHACAVEMEEPHVYANVNSRLQHVALLQAHVLRFQTLIRQIYG